MEAGKIMQSGWSRTFWVINSKTRIFQNTWFATGNYEFRKLLSKFMKPSICIANFEMCSFGGLHSELVESLEHPHQSFCSIVVSFHCSKTQVVLKCPFAADHIISSNN